MPIATLPVPSAIVKVGPPLFCRGPRFNCAEVLVVAQEKVPCVIKLLAAVAPEIRLTPVPDAKSPWFTRLLVLFATIMLPIFKVPELRIPPPPLPAELPEIVELEIVTVESLPIPPAF